MSSPNQIAQALYTPAGTTDAALRQRVNAAFGTRSLIGSVLRLLGPQPGETILDVACGNGGYLEQLREGVSLRGMAVGLDFALGALRLARHGGAFVVQADGCALPIQTAAIDAIACNYALYYFADLRTAISEFRRVLRPSGRLVLTGPAHDTNAELYAFHARVTGYGPSDADTLALGYLADRAVPELMRMGFDSVRHDTFTNEITFPSAEAFLQYWRATSLFCRTVPSGARAAAIAAGARQLNDHSNTLVVTKRVSIVSSGCEQLGGRLPRAQNGGEG